MPVLIFSSLTARLDLGSVRSTDLGSNHLCWIPVSITQKDLSFVRIKVLAQDLRRRRRSSDTRPKEDNRMSLKLQYFQRVKCKLLSSLTYSSPSAVKASLNKAGLWILIHILSLLGDNHLNNTVQFFLD